MFKDYVATENIFDTFECLNLDFGANISLKVNILKKIIFQDKILNCYNLNFFFL